MKLLLVKHSRRYFGKSFDSMYLNGELKNSLTLAFFKYRLYLFL